jgi:hypothetical protein
MPTVPWLPQRWSADVAHAAARAAAVRAAAVAAPKQSLGTLAFLNGSRLRLAAAMDVPQAAPSTDTANSRTAAAAADVPSAVAADVLQASPSADTVAVAAAVPSAAAMQADAKDELLGYMASEVGVGTMSVKSFGTLSTKISACLPGPPLATAGMRERDLHIWCMQQPWRAYLPDLYKFSMQKRVRGADSDIKTLEAPHYAVLPHELFASITAHKTLTEELLTGKDANLRQWWADAAECKGPWFEQLCKSAPATVAALQAVSAAGVACKTAAAASGVHTAAAAVGCTTAAAAGGTAAAAAGAHAASAMGFDRCIPCGMHGDDAGGHGTDKVTVITWGSVAINNGTLDTRLVFSMLKESEAPGCTGLDRLMQVLAWSLNALSDGVYPSKDQDGKDFGCDHHPKRAALAGLPLSPEDRFRGVWAEFRGDWKFLKEAMHLKEFAKGAGDICHRCSATHHGNDSSLWYTNFHRDAHLRETLHDPADYFQSAAAIKHPSPLLKIRDFCISRVFFDIMHTLDLGVLQQAVPSALAELLGCNSQGAIKRLKPSAMFNGRHIEDRLAKATKHYRAWAKRNKCAMHYVTFTKAWVEGAYPHITQYQSKAAELRSIQYWMRDVCAESAEHQEHEHGHVRAAFFEALVQVDEICRRGGRHLSAAAAEGLAVAMEHALLMYNALAVEAFKYGRMLWKLIPKHHALTHIAYDGHGTNPRAVHCYADEDMVGRMKKIYIRCHGSTAPLRSIQRYMILVGVRWHGIVWPRLIRPPPERSSRKWRHTLSLHWGRTYRRAAATFK